MSNFDFDAAIRLLRGAPLRSLARRPDGDLAFIAETSDIPSQLLLDTCVYLDILQGRAPEPVVDLVGRHQINHPTVAIQEMMHGIGLLDPSDPRTINAIRQIGSAIKGMARHRVHMPDADIQGRSGLLSGLLSRVQGYGPQYRYRAVHDCLLYMQARKSGQTLVTANVADFDILQQMLPGGSVLFYRLR